MTKKIFALMLLSLAVLIGGCSDSTHVHDNPKTAQASPVASTVPTFSTQTIDGKPVTNEIFTAKKITVVNIWGTFCPPCIGEMPELGEMARNLPDTAQIIGLVCDTSENSVQIQRALEITKKARATFVNIVPDAALMKFMEGVEAVPTTIFVNSKGEVVGKAIIGADVEGYKHELERLLKD